MVEKALNCWKTSETFKVVQPTTFNQIKNIAGRLPENSHNSFVDLQSQKTVKKTDQKFVFSLKADM